jgi:hypothetical protein
MLSLLAAVLVGAFILSPIETGDDWQTYREAGQRIWAGVPVYGATAYQGGSAGYYYSNPIWIAALLAPLSLLPARWGWAVICVASLAVTLLLVKRWQSGWVKPLVCLLSPPVLYIVLHGQIDALALGGLFLPADWWLLAALTKPQVTLGLGFGIERQRWLRAAALAGLVLLASLILWGDWPLQLLHQPAWYASARHNVWGGLWPFQVPVGIALILFGVRRHDERFLVTASPFLSPYAATSSLLGPWLVVTSLLSEWEAVLVWLSWWGVVAWRYFNPG